MPFLGSTLSCEPFQVIEKFGAPEGHASTNGPPFAVEVAQPVPGAGEPPLSARYVPIAVSSDVKSASQAESCAGATTPAMLCGVVVVVGEPAAAVPGVVGPGELVSAIAAIAPRMTTTISMETNA